MLMLILSNKIFYFKIFIIKLIYVKFIWNNVQ